MSNGTNVTRDEQRRINNERSKGWSSRQHEEWTDEDDMVILDEWILVDSSRRDEMAVSHHVKRSLFACQRRAQELRERLDCQTNAGTHRKQEPQYIGALDDDEDRWWDTSSTTNPNSNTNQ